MPRLPQPGADAGQWGVILNDYLSQSHNTDGSLKSGTVTSASLANASITQSKLSATGGTNGQVLSTDGTNLTWSTPAAAAGDATTTSKGVVQLAGDLAGTADAPTVPELDQKENTIAAGTTSQYYRGDKSWQTLNKAAVGLANVDNTADSAKAFSGAQITSGTVGTARLGSGTADNTTYLRGDGTWATPAGSSGTVTNVSVTTANGVSGSVTNPTTTPAISLTLGAITPSSVAATGTVAGSNLSGTNTGDQTITLTGDVTGSGTGSFAATIGANAVTNAKAAQMAANTIKGNNTGSTANAADLTVAQTKTLLNIQQGDVAGLTSALSGKADDSGVVHITGTETITGAKTFENAQTTLQGNAVIRDAGTATKAYRFRTNGGSLDIEAGGTALYLSTWQNADFTGTQYNQLILKNNGAPVEFGRAIELPEGANPSSAISGRAIINMDSSDHKLKASVHGGGYEALAYDSQVVHLAGTETITNKTISGASNTISNISQSSVTNLTTDLAAKADLASPALTGTPTAPTATGGTNTTQIATTAFVTSAIAGAAVADATTSSKGKVQLADATDVGNATGNDVLTAGLVASAEGVTGIAKVQFIANGGTVTGSPGAYTIIIEAGA